MEQEGSEATIRLVRAIRSLAYNRRLQPLVEDRIERAEATIRSHLLSSETTEARLGPYEMRVDDEGEIQIRRISQDGWRQMPLVAIAKRQECADGSWFGEEMARPTDKTPASAG
jgi:hypothetical protein